VSRSGRARAWGAALFAALVAHGVALWWLLPVWERSGLRGAAGIGPPDAGVRIALRTAAVPAPSAPASPRRAREAAPPDPAVSAAKRALPAARAILQRAPRSLPVPPAVSAAPSADLESVESSAGGAGDPEPEQASLQESGSGALAAPGAGGASARQTYEDLLSRQVQGCLRYPRRALRERIAGDADLTLTIRPDGGLADAILDRSTGSAILDRDALETVRRCVPYPPPPAQGSGGPPGRFAIRLGYDLR